MLTSIAITTIAVSVSVYLLVRSAIEFKAMKAAESSLKLCMDFIKAALPELNTTNKED